MTAPSLLRGLLSLVLLLGPAAGFASTGAFSFVGPDHPSAAEVRQLADAAADTVLRRLQAALFAALHDGGPEKAVEVCHLDALPLTRESVSGHPRIIAVKRTSLRLRNPANAPDAAERAALEHVATLIAEGKSVPPTLVQRLETSGQPPEWRIYRPITVQAACLACHGVPEAQSPALRALLRERYPEDSATGYAVGDWRGLIRVSVQPTSHPSRP